MGQENMRHVLQTRGTYLPKTNVARKYAAGIAGSRYLLIQISGTQKLWHVLQTFGLV